MGGGSVFFLENHVKKHVCVEEMLKSSTCTSTNHGNYIESGQVEPVGNA